MAECPECEIFAGQKRKMEICRGEAGLPIDRTNAYRRKLGFAPFNEWDVSQPSRGLGDTIAKGIHFVTIGKVKPCGGCKKRQRIVNKLVPYKQPEQNREYECALPPRPYGGPVIRHLLYHIWPLENGIWKRNLDQLLPHAGKFNGRIRIGIVTGQQTDSAETVQRYIDDRIGTGRAEYVVKENQPKLGEVWTFHELLEPLETKAANEIIFYAHAKGVRREGHATVHHWASAMYGQLFGRMDEVERLLERSVFAGSFRRSGHTFGRRCTNGWYFSGTFFAFRSTVVFERNWREINKRYWGVEAWPGCLATHSESACLFGDGCGDLYKAHNWEPMAQLLEAQ